MTLHIPTWLVWLLLFAGAISYYARLILKSTGWMDLTPLLGLAAVLSVLMAFIGWCVGRFA